MWARPTCRVVDSTAPTADTLVALGVLLFSGDRLAVRPDCGPVQGASIEGPEAPTPPTVRITSVPASVDLRDLLDGSAGTAPYGPPPDVMVTASANVITYARLNSANRLAPLPWQTTYVLLGGAADALRADASPDGGTILPTLAERAAMARDAVTNEARGAAEPFTWIADSACADPPPSQIAATRSEVRATGNNAPRRNPAVGTTIVYPTGDATARQLAERVVSLATTATPPAWVVAAMGQRIARPLRVVALAADSIAAVIASDRAFAAIMPIERDPTTRCGTRHNVSVDPRAIPLVDTRAHVIVRRGRGAAFHIAPDGSLLFFRRTTR